MENRMKLKKMLYIVALASMATILGLIEIPVVLLFLKIDLSEVIVLVALMVVGYKGALGVVFIRSFFRPLFKLVFPFLPVVGGPLSEYVGELIAIVASVVIMTTYYVVSKLLKTYTKPYLYEIPVVKSKLSLKEHIATMVSTVFSLTIVMALFNFLIGVPLYGSVLLFEFTGNPTIHFTVFSFVNDPNMLGVMQQIGYEDPELSITRLLGFIIVAFSPLNISKAITTTLIVLQIKPRIQHFEF